MIRPYDLMSKACSPIGINRWWNFVKGDGLRVNKKWINEKLREVR